LASFSATLDTCRSLSETAKTIPRCEGLRSSASHSFMPTGFEAGPQQRNLGSTHRQRGRSPPGRLSEILALSSRYF
jgi:hypothetical protein